MQEHNLAGEWHPNRLRQGNSDRSSGHNRSSLDQAVPSDTQFINVGKILTAMRRQIFVIGLGTGIGILLGLLYLGLSPKSYVAYSQILIDANAGQVVADEDSPLSLAAGETDLFNQIEVLRSARLANDVAAMENLTTDVNFLNPPPSFTGRLVDIVKQGIGFVTGRPPEPDVLHNELPPEVVAGQLRRNVVIERVGRSFVLNLGFRSPDRELAYRVARAYASALVQDKLNTNLDASRTAADWLQQRLAELSVSQQQATAAIEDFRQRTGLSLENDTTVVNRRVESLTQQLVLAQSETAQMRAQTAQLEALIALGPEQAASSASVLTGDGVDTASVAELRARRESIIRRIAEVTQTFGADHPQVAALQGELSGVSNDIFVQLQALLEYYRNQVGIAERRETELRAGVESENSRTSELNSDRAQLNELQQRSQALTVLYNSFLSRYEELVQRQSFPIPTARIISEAEMPGAAASPNSVFTMAGALIGGLFFGVGFAFLNEMRERSFRIGDQISKELGLRFVGYLPLLSKRGGRTRQGKPKDHRADVALHNSIRKLIISQTASAPSTAFTETLRSTRLAIDANGAKDVCQIVGIVSALPNEGKTLVSVTFAEMLASSGAKVLLLDADFRHRGASKLAAPDAVNGLLQVSAGLPWRQAIYKDEETGLSVLPTVAGASTDTRDFLGSAAMAQLLGQLRNEFDYVIIDLPPLGPVVDALVIMPWTDSFVFVVAWGKTPRRLIRSIMEKEPVLASHIQGVVLNKVNFADLPNFSEPGGTERFMGTYAGSYQIPMKKVG
ncbi:AAA family ATPase [Devosia sp. SL43]|uniref:AAA family ATPase n=1 Tax=Devosia sp. SL43 TaxID=2806348 RepID=UPI001F443AE9|nr:AAA family ATPase [Devosia sp. SL43]UJW87450.1 AAA family ATPase [Devosia sp. SL43]